MRRSLRTKVEEQEAGGPTDASGGTVGGVGPEGACPKVHTSSPLVQSNKWFSDTQSEYSSLQVGWSQVYSSPSWGRWSWFVSDPPLPVTSSPSGGEVGYVWCVCAAGGDDGGVCVGGVFDIYTLKGDVSRAPPFHCKRTGSGTYRLPSRPNVFIVTTGKSPGRSVSVIVKVRL